MPNPRPEGALVHVRAAGLSFAAVCERLGAVGVALALVLAASAPAAADNLGLEAAARLLAPGPVSASQPGPTSAPRATLPPAPTSASRAALPPAPTPAPRPFDADLSVRFDGNNFHLGGRLLGFGPPLDASVQGRLTERGITLDGHVQGPKSYKFHFDADLDGTLRLHVTPGSI